MCQLYCRGFSCLCQKNISEVFVQETLINVQDCKERKKRRNESRCKANIKRSLTWKDYDHERLRSLSKQTSNGEATFSHRECLAWKGINRLWRHELWKRNDRSDITSASFFFFFFLLTYLDRRLLTFKICFPLSDQ